MLDAVSAVQSLGYLNSNPYSSFRYVFQLAMGSGRGVKVEEGVWVRTTSFFGAGKGHSPRELAEIAYNPAQATKTNPTKNHLELAIAKS